MTQFDVFSFGMTVVGLGVTVVLSLIDDDFKKRNPAMIATEKFVGLWIAGLGSYMMVLELTPIAWGLSMAPKVSMTVGAVLFFG